MRVATAMRGAVAALGCIAGGMFAVEATESEAVREGRAQYAGIWKVVAMESDGNPATDFPEDILVTDELDGAWTLTVGGRLIGRGASRIDPLASPPEVDIDVEEGDGKGSRILGIYEVTDTTRRLCFRGGEQSWRPREFAAAPGSGAVLVTFERQ